MPRRTSTTTTTSTHATSNTTTSTATTTTPRPLVVVCAGDNSLHSEGRCHWSQAARAYDLAVIYYGTNPSVRRAYEREADLFCAHQGPKWQLIARFLTTAARRDWWAARPFVAFPDDDLRITVSQWNALFATGEAYRLDLFQPALVNNGRQYVKHGIAIEQPSNVLRYTNFVEVMAPIFSRRALHRCVHTHPVLTDPRIKSAWGVDYVLPKAILPHHRFDLPESHAANQTAYNVAIVDSVAITHTNPLGDTEGALKSSFYKVFRIDPVAEMKYFMHKWHVRQFTPETLRCVPLPMSYGVSPQSLPSRGTSTIRQSRRKRGARSSSSSTRTQKKTKTTNRHSASSHSQPHPPHPHPPLSSSLRSVDAIRLPGYLLTNLQREVRACRLRRHGGDGGGGGGGGGGELSDYYHKINLGFHGRIRNNVLTVVTDFGSFESRNRNTVRMIRDVLARYRVPDADLLVSTDDLVRSPDVHGVPILAMAKRASQSYLTYPDHSFYDWAEANTSAWDVERARIQANDREPQAKKPCAFFRGNLQTAFVREYIANASRKEAQQHAPKRTLDVVGVDVGAASSTPHAASKQRGAFVSLADHSKWKYLLHIPGRSYAARLKYLLATNSVVLYVRKAPQYEYTEFWYDYLRDGVNCVVIRDTNLYDHANRPTPPKRDKRTGKKIWDDRANRSVVQQIHTAVTDFERGKRDYRAMVAANAEWKRQFDYELVLQYFAVLIREVAGLANTAV